MSDAAARTVLVDRRGPVTLVTIARPERRNAVDAATWERLSIALEAADRDPGCRAIVLAGAGGRAFSAGADLRATERYPSGAHRARGFGGLTRVALDTPVIAAVEGWALGGGFELVLACDLVVAAAGARFGLPEVTRGMLASEGGALRLPVRVSRAVALELLLLGDSIDAARATDLGLVNRLVPDGTTVAEAIGLGEELARRPAGAVGAALRTAHLADPALDSESAALWSANDTEAAMLAVSNDMEGTG